MYIEKNIIYQTNAYGKRFVTPNVNKELCHQGAGQLGKITSPRGKQRALACHLTKE
jgi:hypothetical protein